jgi:heptosyltransferase-2
LKKILIIHTAFIGDIILSTPLIKKIKAKYIDEGSSITYVTTPAGASVLKNNPDLDEIIAYDKRGTHKGFKGLYLLGKRLNYKGFDEVIIPHRYLRSSILGRLTGAPIRIGYDNASGGFLLTKKIPYDRSKHEVEKLLSFIELDNFTNKKLSLYPSEIDKKKIDEIWKKNNLEGKKIILVAPGSKWFTKKWPIEYFNELLKKLAKKSEYRIVLIGGQEESMLNMYTDKNIINLMGKTSLLDVAELCNRSNIIVTNDSSPIHIASAFEKLHIVAIFGATTKELGFFPWSKNSEVLENNNLDCRPCGLHGGDKCPKGHFKCMLDIKPEIVYEKIQNYLNLKP